MLLGYNNRIAFVDLTSRSVSYLTPDEQLPRGVIGGRGLGAAFLQKHSRAKDPLSEESLLFAGVGPLTGSGFPLANRLTFVFWSPQTRTIAWANTGGYAGAELKSSGLDALVVTGRSEKPVFLLAENSELSIRDAASYWGRGAIESVVDLRHQLGDARVLSIGSAGENLVTFANVVNDGGRTSGVRHGVGCLMGSKLLKAIVIRGNPSRRLEVADRAAHIESLKRMTAKIRGSPLLNHENGLLAVHGTPIAAEYLGRYDALPVKNFSSTVLEGYLQVGGRSMSSSTLISRLTCTNCPVACRRETASSEKYHFRVEGPDFAQISSLGTNCGVLGLGAIGYLNQLCYEDGLDPIEMGNQMAVLAELRERLGVADGPEWGDVDTMASLIRQTSKRQGVGEYLGLGPVGLSGHFGAPELNMSVKRLSIQNTDPRVEQAWGLLNATENFGAGAHIWVYADLVYALRESGVPTLVTPESSPWDVAGMVKYKQDLVAVLDSLQVCAFSAYAFSVEDYATELNNVTGSTVDSEELLAIGDRINSIERRFNLEHGVTPADDSLPQRFLDEPLPSGMHRGKVCDLGPMLTEYRKIRKESGSASNGLPRLL
jgi:aldehyde:ferredoxin oxidoreductase